MKSIKTILMLLVLFLLITPASARKMAVFVHGFESNSQIWVNKNTIDDLKTQNIIDDSITFEYSLVGITADQIVSNLVEKINKSNKTGDKWLLVGHSLGGLIVRAAEQVLQGDNSINIVGVVTIGTPHQGAPAADIIKNDAKAISEEYLNLINEGPNTGAHWFPELIYGWQAIAELLSLGITSSYTIAVFGSPFIFELAREKAEEYLGLAEGTKAPERISPGGSLIREINSGHETQRPHRSLIGAERDMTLVRWASEFPLIAELGYDERYVRLIWDEIISWNDINEDYWALSEKWHSRMCIKFFKWENGECGIMRNSRAKKEAWRRSTTALREIDKYWGQAIGSYEPRTYTIEVPSNDCREEPYDRYANCDWTMVEETYTEMAPSKNDGLLPPIYNKWTTNAILNDDQNPYYDDVEEDGGWNHSEMVRYTRIYKGEDTGKPGRDILTPLKRNEEWINNRYRYGGN